jgi:hypothetical protein
LRAWRHWLTGAALACAASLGGAATIVSGPVVVNTVWRAPDGPFEVTGDVRVQGGATLTIEAGTRVSLREGTNLIVEQGALRIAGTAAAPVLLTSWRDQGGDTPAPGDWGQLRFLDGTSDTGTLVEHAVVRFGGGILIERASPALNYLSIERNAGPAITLDLTSSPIGQGLSAQGNQLDGILVPAGEVRDDVVWGLVGIPYVVASGEVSVGAAPTVLGVTPSRIEQGETITVTASGSRLAGAFGVSFGASGLSGSVLPGGTDRAVQLRITAAPAAALGNAAFDILTEAGRALFAPGLAVSPPLPPLTLSGIDPTAIRRGESLSFTLSGSPLQGAVVTSAEPGLSVSALQTTATQASFTLTASASAALGAAVLSVSNPGVAKGSASISVQVRTSLPKVLVTPALLAVPPDGAARQFRVGLTGSDDVDRTFTLSVGDASVAAVTPESFTLAAGQTEQIVSVRGLKLGQTALGVSVPGLAPLTLPVYVTPDFSSINTAYARVVTVQRGAATQPRQQSVTPLLSRAVAVGARRYVHGVSPAALAVGTGPVELVLAGGGLEGVTGASLRPSAGVTLGTVAAAPDGRSVRVLATVAADAALGARQLLLSGAHQPYVFAAGADRVLIVPPAPEIASVTPILAARGSNAVAFVVRGRNLQNVQSLALTPATGIAFGVVTPSADGTVLTTALNVAPDAPLGQRLVTVTTPAGTTSSEPGPANTFRVVETLDPPISPLLSATARVTRQAPPAGPTLVPGLLSRQGRLIKGSVATRLTPGAGSIGDSLSLVISGSGLQGVSQVRLEPADGVTLGTPAAAADGRSVTVPAAIAADAERTVRRVRVFAGVQEIVFADARSAQFRVTTALPQVLGIDPIAIEAGAGAVTLRVAGRNLQSAEAVRIVPPDGIGVSAPPSVNAQGTEATVSISAAAGTAPGPRAVVVVTPAGESDPALSLANTLTVARTLGPAVTPLTARNVNVRRQAPGGGATIAVGPTVSRQVQVRRAAGPPPPASAAVALPSRAAQLVKGPAVVSVAPLGLLRGATASLTVRGIGLGSVSGIALVPSDGVSIGPIERSSDGTQVSAAVTVAAGAAPGVRTVRLTGASGALPFVSPGAAQVVLGDLPVIESIAPIVARRGEIVTLLIRGRSLQSALAVTTQPAAGLSFGANPTVNATGTELTLQLQVAPDAALSARAIQVRTAVGISAEQAGANNTLTVYP